MLDPRRHPAPTFWAAIGCFAIFLVAMAAAAVPQLDDWYEIGWLRAHGGFSWAKAVEFARYNYANYNPRLGESLLLLLHGPTYLRCVLTPAMELLLPCVVFSLAHGAWPRPTLRDLGRLVVIQALIWLAIPVAGVIYFYRPFTANYLFASTIQLGLFVPYRLLGTAVDAPRRVWLAPVMLAWGLVAGMTNEHTGPTAIVALLAWCAWAWRAKRLRPWMVVGLLGLMVGFWALLTAPGQTVRYAGVPTANHPMHVLVERGIPGTLRIVGNYLVEVAPAVALAIAVVFATVRRRPALLAGFDRTLAVRLALPIIAAMSIIVTLFVSPVIEDRVMFASCLLAAIACAALAEVAPSRGLVVIAGALVAIHVAGFAWVYRGVVARTDARTAILEGARTSTTAAVLLDDGGFRDHWEYGEDFTFAYMREYVAHHVYGLDAIDVADAPPWSQPRPPETVRIAATFSPPIELAVAVPDFALATDVPAQWQWVLRELRESWRALASVPGHALDTVDAIVTPPGPLPVARPIYLARWRAGRWQVVDAKQRLDPYQWPLVALELQRLPPGIASEPRTAYIQACGTTETVPIAEVNDELHIPLRYRCQGNHSVFVCGASECWLVWRFW